MRSASVGFQCPSCVSEGAKTIRQAKAAYGGKVVDAPTVTYALIGLNVLVFLITTATGTGLAFGGGSSSVFEKLALAPTIHCNFVDGVCEGLILDVRDKVVAKMTSISLRLMGISANARGTGGGAALLVRLFFNRPRYAQ